MLEYYPSFIKSYGEIKEAYEWHDAAAKHLFFLLSCYNSLSFLYLGIFRVGAYSGGFECKISTK